MSDTFISLKCPNCGARLDVYPDMDRFACGFCGSEMMVHRRGGTVALKAVMDAIQKVQSGTDRTAAELALVRLEKEFEQAGKEYSELERKLDGQGSQRGIALVILGLYVFWVISQVDKLPVVIFSVPVAGGIAWLAYKMDAANTMVWSRKVTKLGERMIEIRSEIEKNRRLVASD